MIRFAVRSEGPRMNVGSLVSEEPSWRYRDHFKMVSEAVPRPTQQRAAKHSHPPACRLNGITRHPSDHWFYGLSLPIRGHHTSCLAICQSRLRSGTVRAHSVSMPAPRPVEAAGVSIHHDDKPSVVRSESDSKAEFILIHYLYLHNLSSSVQAGDLSVKSPVPFRVHIYHSQDSNTQIGFVSLQDISELNVNRLINFLRSLIFDGLPVLVDEMWIKEYNLPDVDNRNPIHISRKTAPKEENTLQMKVNEPLELIEEDEDIKEFNIKLADEPPQSSNLMKSHMIFLMNLPHNLNKSRIIFDMNVPCEGLSLMQTSTEKVAFLYYRQVSEIKWLEVLNKISSTSINDRRIVAKEIYLMSDETVELIQSKYPAIYLSSYVFVYNIGSEGDLNTEELDKHSFIIRHCFMTTDTNTRCAFVQLRDDLTPPQIIEVLNYIRTINICGKIVWADLMWLANITVFEQRPPIINDPRNLWMKEPPEKKFKE